MAEATNRAATGEGEEANTTCHECGHRYARDGPSEVHAEIRDGGEYGLRIDIQFICARCGAYTIIEDVGVDDASADKMICSRFKGQGYRV